jgi:hypothetical protein
MHAKLPIAPVETPAQVANRANLVQLLQLGLRG